MDAAMHAGGDAVTLQLLPAHECDPSELLDFEVENREYFRRWIPDRGDDCFSLEAVASSLARARKWWAAGTDRLHVAVDEAGVVVARANLVHIADGRASIGYRVAEVHAGLGIATAAVARLLAMAPVWGIERVFATTSVVNVGSARVLERCGFVLVGKCARAMKVGDVMFDAFEWETATKSPATRFIPDGRDPFARPLQARQREPSPDAARLVIPDPATLTAHEPELPPHSRSSP